MTIYQLSSLSFWLYPLPLIYRYPWWWDKFLVLEFDVWFFFLFPCRNMIKLNQRPNFTWLNLHNLKSKVHQIIFFFFVCFCIHEEWGYIFMCFYYQKWIHLFLMSLQLINEKKSCHAIHWCLRAFLHWWKSCSLEQIFGHHQHSTNADGLSRLDKFWPKRTNL